ncbi:hypothetical protein F4776DRAFT_663395 [Hypoxylon sp. NC0597]|nr:hypothetical protein F4776DRAFT_663395 [Hypoxylon sp. NC0597]
MRRFVSKFKRLLKRLLIPSVPFRPLSGDPLPSQCNAPLENLPPELRRQILSSLTLDSLNQLIRASPVFYQQYVQDRNRMICTCFCNTLGNSIIDALVAHSWSAPSLASTRSKAQVTDTLNRYQSLRMGNDSGIDPKLYEPVLVMIRFHFRVIRPIAHKYMRWSLGRLASETKDSPSQESLSRTEELRVFRALYRFQLCCQLFGVGNLPENAAGAAQDPGFSSLEILEKFLCLFEPWEIEEIMCVYTFVRGTYDQIFNQIYGDGNEKKPQVDGKTPPTTERAFCFDNSFHRESVLIATVSRGLNLLHTVLFTVKDQTYLRSIIQPPNMILLSPFLVGIDEVLGVSTQMRRREGPQSDRDQKQAKREPLRFEGDREMRPPLAWTVIWKETYSNLYGYYLDRMKSDLRLWGYVMWDAPRLERLGAKDMLQQQWETY